MLNLNQQQFDILTPTIVLKVSKQIFIVADAKEGNVSQLTIRNNTMNRRVISIMISVKKHVKSIRTLGICDKIKTAIIERK